MAHFIATHCTAHILFTTANRRHLPDDYCGAIGVVEKPFTRAGLVSAINFVAACIRDERLPSQKPESLQLSPGYASRWLRHVA